MMNETLKRLKKGECARETSFSLSCGLETFPEEIFTLADTLEILNLSSNRLSELPEDFTRLTKLRILFLSENDFTEVPKVLAACKNLTMIGFKSNRISSFPEDALPLATQWLILTDNQISALPDSIGKLTQLQKCMLAGNKIKTLPKSMAQCRNLELLRISANDLLQLPSWLFILPKLSWLACAGNPCSAFSTHQHAALEVVDWQHITLHEVLGKGASGLISRVDIKEKEESFALKVFKGEVTSDGYPSDEMQACMAAGAHENLTCVHGKIKGHEEEKKGLLLSLIPSSYKNLGEPPNFETCTRDTFDRAQRFSLEHIERISGDIASVMAHLHHRKIMHGDLYAHNILLNSEGHALLGDLGAATVYAHVTHNDISDFERLEVRAFGCLLEDMLSRCENRETEQWHTLWALKHVCMLEEVKERPLFETILTILAG